MFCNDNELVTGDFTRNPQFKIKSSNMKKSLISNFNKNSTWFLNSTEFSKLNLGNTIYSNLVLFGYAFQAGFIPLKFKSICLAIKTNSKKSEMNLNAFNLGRNLYINDESIIKNQNSKIREKKSQYEDPYTFRHQRLKDYAGSKFANKFKNKVNKYIKLDEELGEAVSEGYFNVLYNKDEIEVARLHVKYLKENLDLSFQKYKNIKFFLAPPILSFIKINGRPKKFKFGSWTYFIFYLLIFLKPFRNSMVDIFSFSKERKMEIELLKSYENDLNFISNNFNRQNKKILIEIARLPTKVLGFGPVKVKSIENHYLEREILYTKLKEFNKIKLAAAE